MTNDEYMMFANRLIDINQSINNVALSVSVLAFVMAVLTVVVSVKK